MIGILAGLVLVAAIFAAWLRWTRADYDRIANAPRRDPRDFTSEAARKYHGDNSVGR